MSLLAPLFGYILYPPVLFSTGLRSPVHNLGLVNQQRARASQTDRKHKERMAQLGLPTSRCAAPHRAGGAPTRRQELATHCVAPWLKVGWPTGLEPVTFGATIRCSTD